MNHKMKFGMLLLLLFFIVGCDKTTIATEDLEEIFPSIKIVGDDLITIEQNTVFTDPGAEVIGDFDLQVTVETDLDISVLGDYTVTYTIVYEGKTYSGVRTVRVIAAPEPIDLDWELSTESFTTDTIRVLVSYTDTLGVLTNGKGSLYQDTTLIRSFDLISGDNYLNYSDLQSNTTYTFVVEGSYDDNGTVVILDGYDLTITTAELTEMQFSLSNEAITHNTYSTDITIDKASSNILTTTAYLYLGEALVDQVILTNPTTTFSVDGLLPETEYALKVVYTATPSDGGETDSFTEELDTFSTDMLPAPEFVLLLSTPGTYNLECAVGVSDTGLTDVSLTVEVWEDGTYKNVFDVSNMNTYVNVTDLDPGTTYTLKLYADYKVEGSDVLITDVLIHEEAFTTNELLAPKFVSLVATPGYYNLACDVDVLETGLSNVSLRFEVWEDGAYKSLFYLTDNNTYVDITDLEPATTYTLKLYADYKIEGSDDLIAYTLIHEEAFTTNVLTTYMTPTVDNLVITKVVGTLNSVTFDFDLSDPDDVIDGNIWLRLYKGSSQSAKAITVGHNTITFEGYPIDANTLYRFVVTTDYQQDEETFVWGEIIHETSFLMPPIIEVSSYTQQKSMYFHGDRIILILSLDNTDDMNVEYVTINGKQIYQEDFLFPSNAHTIYLDMGVETDYTDYYYQLTDYAVTMVDDSSYVLNVDETITFRLQQPGDIDPEDSEVNVLEITTDDYTKLVSSVDHDYTNVTIHLDNEYNLDVYSVSVNNQVFLSTSFEEGSNTKQIILQLEIDRLFNDFRITDLVFVRNDVNVAAASKNINVSEISIYGYYLEDAVIISSAAELNSINPSAENKYYYLAQDLDLTGFPMEPIGTASSPFQGVFDGNGKTISNFSYTSLEASQNNDVYLGLFGKSVGFIYNLTMFNSNITVVTDETHTLYVGVLAAQSIGDIIDCKTLGTNTINISGMTEGYVGGLSGIVSGFIRDTSAKTDIYIDGLSIDRGSTGATYVGGLFGIAGVGSIETSSSNGTISIIDTVNNTNHVGGLIGRFYNSTSDYATPNYILYSYASVDIYTSNYGDGSVGGLVGTINNEYADNTEVKDSYATGDIYSDRGYIGGLVGQNWSYITNSFATGNIDRIGGYADRFAEYGSDLFLTNNYVYDAQTVSYEGIPGYLVEDIEGRLVTASANEYNDEDFYIEVLGWNDYFWEFSSLTVTADIMPEHQ